MATARAYAPLAEVATSITLAIPFTGTQPHAGDKIITVFWAFGNTFTPTVSSVKDNATSQNTYTLVVSRTDPQGGGAEENVFCYYLDLPGNATWSGNYTITVTWVTNAPGDADGSAAAYIGSALGNATATNNNGSTSASADSGSISPSGSGLYVGGVTDASGANPATLTPGSSFTNEATQLNGASFAVGAFSDLVEGSGTKSANWTLEGSLVWSAIVAFFADVATTNPGIVTYAYSSN